MVNTRRGGADSVLTSNTSLKPMKRRKLEATAAAASTDKLLTTKAVITRNSSSPSKDAAFSMPSSELSELTPTSPSTGITPEGRSPVKPGPYQQEQPKPSTEQVMTAMKKLVTPGSSHNPIILIEDSPPSKLQVRMKQHADIEPHKFQNRHSKLYTYKAPRLALAPKPANGSTFTGHPGHDMYRMRTAKMAPPAWNQQVWQGLPFELQYPMSAQYLASHPSSNHLPPGPAMQYYSSPPLPYVQYTAPPTLSEDQLRNKALQYVREYLRASPRKRKMPDDPGETSDSEPGKIDLESAPHLRDPHTPRAPSSSSISRAKKNPVTILPDPHFKLPPLVEQASLLTCLLQAYPHSNDQKNLRKDIARLATVQNQHLADWLNFEVGQSRKLVSAHKPRVSESVAASPTKPVVPRLTNGERAEVGTKSKQDEEIRGLLSADAEMWQDGSGLGVADVYAETRAFSPAAGQEGKNEAREDSAVVTTSSPVCCTAKAATRSPDVPAGALESLKVNAMPSSTLVTPLTRRHVTSSPKVTRTVSSPAVRMSERKRTGPGRFRTE